MTATSFVDDYLQQSELPRLDFREETTNALRFPRDQAQILRKIADIQRGGWSQIILVDRGFPLPSADRELVSRSAYCLVNDQLNLSAANPLLGHPERRFFPMNDVYRQPPGLVEVLPSVIALGLPLGVVPTAQEAQQLSVLPEPLVYCYQLVLAALVCSYQRLSVIGLLQIG